MRKLRLREVKQLPGVHTHLSLGISCRGGMALRCRMNTFGSSWPQQGTVYAYLLAEPKGKTLLADFPQPVHPVSLIQSGLSNSVIGLATFPTC